MCSTSQDPSFNHALAGTSICFYIVSYWRTFEWERLENDSLTGNFLISAPTKFLKSINSERTKNFCLLANLRKWDVMAWYENVTKKKNTIYLIHHNFINPQFMSYNYKQWLSCHCFMLSICRPFVNLKEVNLLFFNQSLYVQAYLKSGKIL